MQIPTAAEVSTYAADIGFKLDGGYFCDYWESRGWLVRPGIPMRSWQAAVRNWQRMDQQRSPGAAPTAAKSPADILRAEASARRLEVIKEAAGRIVAMRSWIRSGQACPWSKDPQSEIDADKSKIFDHYGQKGADGLHAAVLLLERQKIS